MASITFPEPVTFDTFGGPGSSKATVKVLEEAAEFVEAVKRYGRLKDWYDSGTTSLETKVPPDMLEARKLALAEAMDVYQAVANFLGEPAQSYKATFDDHPDRSLMNKEMAMGVLCAAAGLFSDCGKDHHRYDMDNADDVLWNLAFTLCCEFTDDEIVAAYAECVERNRERGRL